MNMSDIYQFTVNDVPRQTEENKSLLRYLRDDLHLYSVKDGCSEGACGTCTVIVDGRAAKACILTTAKAAGKTVSSMPSEPAAPSSAVSAHRAW